MLALVSAACILQTTHYLILHTASWCHLSRAILFLSHSDMEISLVHPSGTHPRTSRPACSHQRLPALSAAHFLTQKNLMHPPIGLAQDGTKRLPPAYPGTQKRVVLLLFSGGERDTVLGTDPQSPMHIRKCSTTEL